MKILVSGGAGYIGSVLVGELVRRAYDVICLDRFFFGKKHMLELARSHDNLKLIQDDIRWFNPNILEGVDAIMDLAALSNDPVGELDPSKTFDINFLGRVRVAKLSKKYGVKRYLLPSSASNYGAQDGIVNEESPTFPLTAYSQANALAEKDVLSAGDKDFCVTVMRFSSVFGISSRMRFDLAVNNMALSYLKTKKILVSGTGEQYRPFLHIRDAAEAYFKVLHADEDIVRNQIFNIGADNLNYKILDLAHEVGRALGGDYELQKAGSKDARSYVASFKKIKDVLGFEPKHTVADGAREVYGALKDEKIADSKETRTVEWYKHLIEIQQTVKDIAIKDTIL